MVSTSLIPGMKASATLRIEASVRNRLTVMFAISVIISSGVDTCIVTYSVRCAMLKTRALLTIWVLVGRFDRF